MIFFYFFFLKNGVKPSVPKILALKEAKRRQDIKVVGSYLGMINYLKHFIPDFSTFTYIRFVNSLIKTLNLNRVMTARKAFKL